MATNKFWLAATIVSAVVLAATDANASTISMQLGSSEFGVARYFGQGVTTPAGGPWNNISFYFDSQVGAGGTTPFAIGDLFLLNQTYAGTPAALSSSTPGFLAMSTGISGGTWVFDASVVLQPLTTYYFLMGDRPSAALITLAGI